METSKPLTGKISNWEKPGGKLGMVVAGLLGAGGLFVLYKLLPFLITLASNVITLALLLAAIALILFLITDKKVRLLVSTGYFMLMRAITGAFIEIDPVAIVERRLVEMKKRIQEISEKMGILKGYNFKTANLLADKKSAFETEMLRKKTYLEQGLSAEAQVSNNQAVRLEGQVKNLIERLAAGEKTYKILSQLERMAKLSVQDTENDIEIQKENFESARQQYKVFKSVLSILNGNPDEMAQYQQAMDYMAKDMNDKLGEMSHVLDQTGGLLVQFSIDNGVADKKANELLDRYDKLGIEGMFESFTPKTAEVSTNGVTQSFEPPVSNPSPKKKYF